ncbi:MAG: SPFH domain-containing protein [Ignavibacteriaceae bacterium]|nr:SPFH domain-containing protein [Ignavibacterium sp.]MCC6256291.1 SPFH domain-containing protein [Ignavibacteriaceae bacterium]HMN23846.1 SPFH domain-containing protein [Ignavibacteriaceae bacterium]HRN26542.1 SPFH domain-containing protein [Ignavibacteriaceae bacterium]HRP91835.1 SPFH domain-containing protein [Ignavibacteriaceae bacterium]
MDKITEKSATKLNGFIALFILIALIAIDIYLLVTGIRYQNPSVFWFFIPLVLISFISLGGFLIVQPNESKVLILFGSYTGTIRESGFWWVNPFTIKKHVSLRIRNFNSDKIKVNDLHGNPIEIAAVIVWRVIDSARAIFDVQNYEQFVAIQAETAIRTLASEYPYDTNEGEKESLRSSPTEVAENLQKELQKRLEVAGVTIVEARITHLAYAQEIAQAMLRRQQAQAIVAARFKIVEGAVGMVQQALQDLSDKNIVNLDEERKAQMVNNLMVALVADHEAIPVINTGTIYQ